MEEIRERIKKYKELKADIVDIEIKLEELEKELGVSEQPSGERTSHTYKITSQTEVQARKYMEKKEELLEIKKDKEREILRIDNAMTVLGEEESDILKIVLIEGKRYGYVEMKYNICYRRIKQIEEISIDRKSVV